MTCTPDPGAFASLIVPEALQSLVRSRIRQQGAGCAVVAVDGTSPIVHVAESIGIPRTEIAGALRNGRLVRLAAVPEPGDQIALIPVQRPQSGLPQRYLLDVHLGTLARRMRLLGLDTAYRSDACDVELVVAAQTSKRVLLTRDRGLLCRRLLPFGAFVYGDRPAEQLADVLDRFAPLLRPWTRCPACNGLLEPVAKESVAHVLKPGTRSTYERFSQCQVCGRPYWRGAHAEALDLLVARAAIGGDPGPSPLTLAPAEVED